MKFLDIGAVAEKAGIPPSTLRYYEEVGLITSVSRHGLRRQYAPGVLLQLKLIAMGKMAGFSLDDISKMFGKDGAPEVPRAALHLKADEIDRQARELTALSNTLRHVADCRAPSHLECPTFRRLLDVAGRQSGRRRSKPGSVKAPRS
jgi:DNA-binding transcriptional MerR regulator